jgi:hypothetical protein
MHPSPEPSEARRRFLKTVGLAGLTTALGPAASALAQASAPGAVYPPGVTPPKGAPKAGAPPAKTKVEPPSADARTLAGVIRRRYGQHLDHKQIESITRDFDGDLKAAQRLHEVKLANGDEPDFTVHA